MHDMLRFLFSLFLVLEQNPGFFKAPFMMSEFTICSGLTREGREYNRKKEKWQRNEPKPEKG